MQKLLYFLPMDSVTNAHSNPMTVTPNDGASADHRAGSQNGRITACRGKTCRLCGGGGHGVRGLGMSPLTLHADNKPSLLNL